MFIIYLNMRKSCSVLWTFSHVSNIILRSMIKGWWYRYQSRQTNTVVMFFQYYICKYSLFSTKYMINTEYYMSKSASHAVSTREPYITPRAIVMFIISYISTMPLIIHVFRYSLYFYLNRVTSPFKFIIYSNCYICKFWSNSNIYNHP